MADAAEDLEPVEDLDIEEIPEPEAPEPEAEPEGEDDGLDVTFDGEGSAPPRGEDTDLVRHLREQVRERDRRLKALEAQSQPQKIEVGEKPTLAGCEYDEERFERELDGWKERKAQAQQQEQTAAQQQREALEEFNRSVETARTQIATLGVKDVASVEREFASLFSPEQQSLIIGSLDKPGNLIVALTKNPAKAAELAQIKNPAKFIAQVAKLEEKVKLTPRAKPPAPEQIVRGSAPLSQASDKHLERLEKEAERTGDRTKVVAYKRQLRLQGKS